MPKVVVYIRADDARMISATEGRDIDKWVRTVVREQVAHWHARRLPGVDRLPEPWARRQDELKEGA